MNGGLFEPLYGYNWVETEILLPDTLFANDEQTKDDTGTGILDVFDRYNFTVNEAEPLAVRTAIPGLASPKWEATAWLMRRKRLLRSLK